MLNSINSYKEAIELLDNLSSEQLVSTVKLLSSKKEINLKYLKTKQQKALLNAAVDASSESYKFSFLKDLYNIFSENCENVADVENFTQFDRIFLTLVLRSHLSEFVTLTNDKNETESFSLKDIINNFQDFEHPQEEAIHLQKNNIDIDLKIEIPLYIKEIEYMSVLPSIKDKESEKDFLKRLISETYIYEISKYIKEIKIAGKTLNYDNLGVHQKCSIIEKLPADVAHAIIQNVTKWKELINKYLTVTFKSGESKVLEPDVMLFLMV